MRPKNARIGRKSSGNGIVVDGPGVVLPWRAWGAIPEEPGFKLPARIVIKRVKIETYELECPRCLKWFTPRTWAQARKRTSCSTACATWLNKAVQGNEPRGVFSSPDVASGYRQLALAGLAPADPQALLKDYVDQMTEKHKLRPPPSAP
jgi:hypothetical protein